MNRILPRLPLISTLCGFLALVHGSANAATLVNEDFGYADGNLVGNGGWTNVSGSGSFITVSGGAATAAHGSGSREDAGILFADVNTGVLLASFDLTVNDDAPIAGTDFEYFAHFSSSGSTSTFRSRVDVVAGAAGDYSLGISTGTATAQATLPVDFTFGNPVSIQLSYDFGTSIASLTAGGNTINGTASVTGSLNTFHIRQSDSTSDESFTIDNLVVTGTPIPEPSTGLLGLIGTLAMVARRCRK